MFGLEMIAACGVDLEPAKAAQIIQVESGGDPLAINVNKGRLERKPKSVSDAVYLAKKYISMGYTVDLGLMQINSSNISGLGYSIEDMFEPCKNVSAGSKIYNSFYTKAKAGGYEGDGAHKAALSAYNTGSFTKGFINGYIAKYAGGNMVAAIKNSLPSFKTSMPKNAYDLANAPGMDSVVLAYSAPFSGPKKSKEDDMQNNGKIEEENSLARATVSRSQKDESIPGVQVEYSPDDARAAGAFKETAMSEEDAWASNLSPRQAPTEEEIGNDSAVMIKGRLISDAN